MKRDIDCQTCGLTYTVPMDLADHAAYHLTFFPRAKARQDKIVKEANEAFGELSTDDNDTAD